MPANLEKLNDLFEQRDAQGFSDLGGTAQIAKDLLDTDPERGLQSGVAASRAPKNTFTSLQKSTIPDLLEIEISDYVVVRGDGDSIKVKGAELVRGDILKLKEGDLVPVDALVLSGLSMTFEGNQTGESDSVPKAATNDCCLLAGSKILEGSCTCVVLNAGSDSSLGKTADNMLKYDACNEKDYE